MKSTLAAGAGMALAASMGDLVWAKSGSEEEIADMSLQQLSQMIQSGELSSRKLVEIYLQRIQKYGGPKEINAYITVAGEAALKEAEELDRQAKGKQFKGPLHGLPIAVRRWRPGPDSNSSFAVEIWRCACLKYPVGRRR